MNKKESTQLLVMYESLLDAVDYYYSRGSPVVETSETEGKLEQMRVVLSVLGIPFKE